MTKLELGIAWRYLRSRRGSKLLSLISLIAIGGILVGSPDIRVLSYGEDLKIDDWQSVLKKVRAQPGVVTAAPFVLTEALMTAGHDYAGGVYVAGLLPQARGVPDVTT